MDRSDPQRSNLLTSESSSSSPSHCRYSRNTYQTFAVIDDRKHHHPTSGMSNSNNATIARTTEEEEDMTVDTDLLISEEGDSEPLPPEDQQHAPPPPPPPAAVYRNFVFMAILFSIHHGCVVSCLSLATARLGADIGAGQSSILYLAYTGTALLGGTYVVKRAGAHAAVVLGMFLYCFYVAAFGWAAHFQVAVRATAYAGAVLGGMGAGLVWTAQGSFFAQAASAHAQAAAVALEENDDDEEEEDEEHDGLQSTTTSSTVPTTQDLSSQSTARMAGVFAFFYLALELLLRSLSSVASWRVLFNTYGLLTVLATVGMAVWVKPPNLAHEDNKERPSASLLWYQATAAIQLWKPTPDGRWPVMPLLLGLNAVFGFESSFLNAYINGQVVPAQSVGIWMSWASGVAAMGSLVFGRWTAAAASESSAISSFLSNRKGWVLSAGAVSFVSVVLPFVLKPNTPLSGWTSTTSSFSSFWICLFIYTLHGTGRATFEGTLKATFADFFPHEKEGAFANIILQNGLTSSLGYFLTSHLSCHNEDDAYCVSYKDGTHHHVGWMEVFVVSIGVLAIAGYWQAARMVRQQREEQERRGHGIPDGEEREEEEDPSRRRLV